MRRILWLALHAQPPVILRRRAATSGGGGMALLHGERGAINRSGGDRPRHGILTLP